MNVIRNYTVVNAPVNEVRIWEFSSRLVWSNSINHENI